MWTLGESTCDSTPVDGDHRRPPWSIRCPRCRRPFRAYLATRATELRAQRAGVRRRDLPPGEVEIRVAWSSVNYKDGLAARADGKVARISPLIPGIDLAGEVVASDDPRYRGRCGPWSSMGMSSGFRATVGTPSTQRVPADWVVPLAPGLSPRDAWRSGRPVSRPRCRSSRSRNEASSPLRSGPRDRCVAAGSAGPRSRSWPIGATRCGRRQASQRERPARSLGAVGILERDEVTATGRPLESERWAGAVDAVGGATLPYVLRTLEIGAVGRLFRQRGRRELVTTVFPFILRGVSLLGMDSVHVPISRRRGLWDRLATDLRPRGLGVHCKEVTLDTLDAAPRRDPRGRSRVAAGSSASASRARGLEPQPSRMLKLAA